MTIDKLIQESRIEFPRSLSLKETKELLDYIAIHIPAEINTLVKYYENRYPINNKEKKLKLSLGTVKINGNIKDLESFTFDSFIINPDESNCSKLNVIEFQTIPGYNLEEHRREVRKLWENTRIHVENYFKETAKQENNY